MTLTEEMLDTAVRKAIEAGLLPRHACHEDRCGQRELIRFILQGVLATEESAAAAKRGCLPVCERFAKLR